MSARADQPKVVEPVPIPSPLPWQAAQWQRLGAQWVAGRCPHALLISGQTGLGKRRFAEAFAALLLCDQPRHGLACGECRGCQLRIAGSHPDFTLVVPEKEQGPLKVEQIRDLGEFVGRTSGREGARVVMLAPAEAMNINAANALLKNLEEPSGSVIFLLITDHPAGLLPTIRSRCQTIAFPVPPQQSALRWMRESGIESEDADSALNLAGGAPLLAVQLMEPESREARQQFLADLSALTRGDENPVTLAGKWENPGEGADLNLLLQFWQSWLALMLKSRSTDQAAEASIMALLQRMPGTGAESLRPAFAFYDHLLKARALLSGNSNPNKRLLLEELLIRWAALFR
ncbi:DNA polymerase III subunit delta' [Microbulbifer elongatus]|uniref:DNA polymerase III subunit delta' n=1 Tax=Microbulbifer elongatus TaxID=86173 RepID=A0ABT1P4A2_9GAMM|nr:DNA polymerase III subunit delta' [Microbulbifer elongatus]MCQ3830372.1 DNA polymerase III subunit delta' [Microbulbifer elongatus]